MSFWRFDRSPGRRTKPPRGFALVYAMLVSVSFLLFFSALVYNARDTMRAVSIDENLVRARALAAVGNELGFHLLRSKGTTWLEDEDFSFSNQEDAPDFFAGVTDHQIRTQFSEAAVGGTFRVKFISTDSTEASDVSVPEGGTYMVMQCVASVNGRETAADNSSRFLIKLGVPFVNNLSCMRGSAGLGSKTELHGPVFVTLDPPFPGTLDIVTHLVVPSGAYPGTDDIIASTSRFSGTLQVKNGVRLIAKQNGVSLPDSTPVPPGSYSAGEDCSQSASLDSW